MAVDSPPPASRVGSLRSFKLVFILAAGFSVVVLLLIMSSLASGSVQSIIPTVNKNTCSGLSTDGVSNQTVLPAAVEEAEISTEPVTGPTELDPIDNRPLTPADIAANDRTLFASALAAHPRPIRLLRYCNSPPNRGTEDANFLVSSNGPERTLLRLSFPALPKDDQHQRFERYNPNVIPFPQNYNYPYLGFARQSRNNTDTTPHEVVYCEMDWAYTTVGRKILRCANDSPPKNLALPTWRSQHDSCTGRNAKLRDVAQGPSDPRVFFSPAGEPLMILGTNGFSTCMSQFVVDLRAVIPDLATKMNLTHVPMRYDNLTELPRDHFREIERNWFVLYDHDNVEHVQHEISPRSVSTTSGADAGKNMLLKSQTEAPACLKALLRNEHSALNQATNALRVTMCEFPCIPTVHNTVLVSIVHVKYTPKDQDHFFRRYVNVMNMTAPFNILARTNNLVFAGADEKQALYAVSMAWDPHYQTRRDWDDEVDAKPSEIVQVKAPTLESDMTGGLLVGFSDSPDTIDLTSGFDVERETVKFRSRRLRRRDSRPAETPAPTKPNHKHNLIADGHTHGWIDDMVMINIGVNDSESGILHTPMKDILECLKYCDVNDQNEE
ncbi:hypothetical protein V1517DRAFT_116327 [Lipomyces orientalis]|uniref:Uncharacterized protein n=1 Tax=Lipomyces orientalis TaxID=1233043 RepID=A0ACC3TP89_9ASCO